MSDNIEEQIEEVKEKLEMEELNYKKYTTTIFDWINIIVSMGFPQPINFVLMFLILNKFFYQYKMANLSDKRIDLLSEKLQKLESIKNICKHLICEDNGYYYLTKEGKEGLTDDKLIADFRKCTCLACNETIELFKTDNPNWDFTYEGVEINIEQSHQKKKKRSFKV